MRVISFASTLEEQRLIALSDEHSSARWFSLDQVPGLVMPDGYKRSIRLAAGR